MPLKPLLKNKLLLQKHFHVNEFCLDQWPFWMLEENIKIVNELNEEEEKQRKQDEESQQKSGFFMFLVSTSYFQRCKFYKIPILP